MEVFSLTLSRLAAILVLVRALEVSPRSEGASEPSTRIEFKRLHQTIRETEEEPQICRPHGVTYEAFQLVISHVTRYAQKMIRDDWIATVSTAEALKAGGVEAEKGPYACKLVDTMRTTLQASPLPPPNYHRKLSDTSHSVSFAVVNQRS